MLKGERTSRRPGGRSGSATANRISSSEAKAGITANQNTAWMSFARSHMSSIASSGPRKAPIEGLPQPKAGPAQPRWGDIGDQRIARRAADALADAIDEPGRHGEDQPIVLRDGEQYGSAAADDAPPERNDKQAPAGIAEEEQPRVKMVVGQGATPKSGVMG